MKGVPSSVSITTTVFIFFLFLCGFDPNYGWALSIFSILNIMIVWMVYSVLKMDYTPQHTFAQRFYEDQDNKRIADTEENDSL
jgi:hypothetical protein